MTSHFINDPDHWRQRAGEMLALADEMKDAETRLPPCSRLQKITSVWRCARNNDRARDEQTARARLTRKQVIENGTEARGSVRAAGDTRLTANIGTLRIARLLCTIFQMPFSG